MKADRIFVVGHGDLPESLLASARLIAGQLQSVSALGLQPNDTPSTYGARLSELLDGAGNALILTDLQGGTPDNVASVIARRRPGTWVLTNASLPVLIECALGDIDLTPGTVDELATLTRVTPSHWPEPAVPHSAAG